MRTCPKCGRANQPTRKYCIRCGGNLLTVESKPKTISSPTVTPEPEVKEAPPTTPPPSEARVTTNDEWVKPSQVSPDRVRSAEDTTKPKSEMEKAKEAFAKADQVGIQEEGEGIIETRMLRASEVQELMGELESQRSAPAAPPSAPTPAAAAPPPTSMNTPPTSPPPSAGPPGTAPAAEPPPAKMATPDLRPAAPPPKPPTPDFTAKAPSTTTPPARPAAKPAATSISAIESVLSTLTDRAYRQDPQIHGIVNDLTNLHTEMAQFNSDLDGVRARLESEVRDYWNVAEVKRIQFESVEEQLRLSKQEWNDATKVYQQSAKRMKNELTSREKRIKDIQKRIEKAESSIGKRAKDLDKEKEKQAL